ncbi:hypothetical protein M1N67_00455 [Peptococcaceae bacterium]|nr:hypothetical protein [Peptococcaceae bacterium]
MSRFEDLKENNQNQVDKEKIEELVNDTLKSMDEYLPKLKNSMTVIAEKIQGEGEEREEGFKLLTKAIEGITWCVDAVVALKKFGYLTEIDLESTNKVLRELEDALKKQGFVLAADILEYEIEPVLGEWIGVVKKYVGDD